MNIENIFSEINCFIKNPKQYELLYYKDDIIHNEYALDEKEAERIMNCLNKLQQENQQLKIQISAREENYKKLEDNWNKLKEYIEQEISIPMGGREFCCYSNVRDKIKELERGVSDVED